MSKRTYTKETFQKIDFDDQCSILEHIMPNEYYNQESLELDLSEGESESDKKKFKNFIESLTELLFEKFDTVEYDLEKESKRIAKQNEEFLSRGFKSVNGYITILNKK